MADQSLRGFIELVERDFPDDIVRVAEPVRRELDITSTVFELERAGRSPIVVFENVEGFDMPVVTNVAGNRRLLAAALGVEPDQLPAAYRTRCQNYVPVERVDSAPWQEVVLEGDQIDLTRLPIPLHFEVDAAPYITAGQISARDPQSNVDTTGFHRLMLKGKDRLGLSLHSRRRMYEFPPPRRSRWRAVAGRDHARHPSDPLHGVDGLPLSAGRPEVRDHRRVVRRGLPGRALRHGRPRPCPRAPRSSSRERS